MTATSPLASPRLSVRLANALLAVRPLAQLAKHQARSMMIRRAESIGVYWRDEVKVLQARQQNRDSRQPAHHPDWDVELEQVRDCELTYPDYYLKPFHAYDRGNLSWDAAMEVEVAARAVHARIWPEAGAAGDAKLRQSYHDVLQRVLSKAPRNIVDAGCSVGMSSFALQQMYPQARVVGLDLSPYFLAIAQYRARQRQLDIAWKHAAAEATGLPEASCDLVSLCLVCHELPSRAAESVLREARRILRPGGHVAIMDMNPQSDIHRNMPPYVLTLLKSTEPYLDEYFALDLPAAIASVGFEAPTVEWNSPRHRTLIARVA
ncbi:MAG: class I SAM-dependent methyltransferase [Cyanobacteria bacterium P01_D01_bin.123]